MEKIYDSKRNLIDLLKAYIKLNSVGQLHSKKGFILYTNILQDFDKFIVLTHSAFFEQERDLLPTLTKVDFTNYNIILQEEYKSQSGIFNYFYGILISKKRRLSSTEKKFQTTRNIFNGILRSLADPELENIWYSASSPGGV